MSIRMHEVAISVLGDGQRLYLHLQLAVEKFVSFLYHNNIFGTFFLRPERRVSQHFCPPTSINDTTFTRLYRIIMLPLGWIVFSRGRQYWKTASRRVDCICPTRQ